MLVRAFPSIALVAVVPLLAAVACEPSRPTAMPGPAASPAPVLADGELKDAAWARFESKRFDLEIALPDGKTWSILDHGSPWLTASHPSSQSSLRVRIWRELELVSRDRCEQRAREWSPDLPSSAEARVIDDRPLPAVPAPGFDTRLVAGILRDKAPEVLHGFVLAFGASGRKCFALAFQTRAHGPGAAERIGDRLGLGVRVLEGAFIVSDLAPSRVPPPTQPQR